MVFSTNKILYFIQDLEDEMAQSVSNGSLSKKDYNKLVTSLKKDFPDGIPRCGTDALRFGLTWNDTSSGQIKLDVTRTMKTSSAFCNKIWQAARFLLLARERKPEFQPTKIQPENQHSQR